MKRWLTLISLLPAIAFAADRAHSGFDPAAAERGRRAMTGKCFNPAVWSRSAYDNAWRRWEGIRAKPTDYDAAFCEHYGLHPAPFPNNGLPMGLREGPRLLGKGISVDCLVCHGGSILGQSYVGLGNSSLDIQQLFDDLSAADGIPFRTPFTFTQVRGTSEAAGMAVYLLGRRNPDLTLRPKLKPLGLHDDLCEDAPAWWLLKKKKTMYWTGGADQRSVRSMMQFMMSPLNGPSAFKEAEADFVDIRQYFLSIEPPKYPYPIDADLAALGQKLFAANCSRCHGTYGPNPSYPNKIIPIDEIGTDRRRYDGLEDRFGEYYDQTWFAQEQTGWFNDGYLAKASKGYQAPPLDGIWATAPYFHNGSAPTVFDVLNSESRPARFTRSYRTGADEYDPQKLGWKVTPVPANYEKTTPYEGRKVYDTHQIGRSSRGHEYGDHLTEKERAAMIEYMKTF